jgi:iron complex transport system ATP-binding protein
MTGNPLRSALLQLENVHVRLSQQLVLRDVSLSVEPGEILALVGPNGSGKTTLLRAALGLIKPEKGQVFVKGRSVTTLSPRERALIMAWVPQQEFASENLTVEDFVALGRYPHLGSYSPETSADNEAIDSALTETSLLSFRERGILELSGGERQRALYARALAQGTPLLLLDEPTSHLDIAYQLEVMEKLSSFRRSAPGRAVVVSLHDLNLACRFADRILWLSHGHCVTIGTPASTVTQERVFEVFGVDTSVHRRGEHVFVFPPERRPPSPPKEGGLNRVHVVCGGGSGKDILRELVSRGYTVTAGALNLLDSDEEFCQTENITMAVEDPFTQLSEDVRLRHRTLMADAEVIVIAPFAVGEGNLVNMQDPLPFVAQRPSFLIGGSPEMGRDFTGGKAADAYAKLLRAGAKELADLTQLYDVLASLPPPGKQHSEPQPEAPVLSH